LINHWMVFGIVAEGALGFMGGHSLSCLPLATPGDTSVRGTVVGYVGYHTALNGLKKVRILLSVGSKLVSSYVSTERLSRYRRAGGTPAWSGPWIGFVIVVVLKLI